MISDQVTSPRSHYPNFKKRKFDYTRPDNIDGYDKAAAKLGIRTGLAGPDQMSTDFIWVLLEKILVTDSLHEMTLYADMLWDAYNSHHLVVSLIETKIKTVSKPGIEKLQLLIQYLRLETGLNRRNIMGKHFHEINKDIEYYREIAEKAKQLLVFKYH
jgi:hypothetical protein